MAETPASSAPAGPAPTPTPIEPPASGGGFFQNLVDLYFAPSAAFTRIVRRPSLVLPLLVYLVVSLLGTAVWMRKVDATEFVKAQMEQFGGRRFEQLSNEQKQQAIDTQVRFFAVSRWSRVAIGTVLVIVVPAAVLLFIFRFFYSGETTFRQALAVVAWTLLTVELITTPLRLLVMALKGDWNMEPQLAIQASPGALMDPSAPKWQWGLASIPDLFTLWMLFLLATGFAATVRRTTGSALWGVAIPWAILALGGVAMMAAFM